MVLPQELQVRFPDGNFRRSLLCAECAVLRSEMPAPNADHVAETSYRPEHQIHADRNELRSAECRVDGKRVAASLSLQPRHN